MTDKTRSFVKSALQWALLFIPALTGAWGIAHAIGATKLDVVTYQSDRRADSLIHVGELRDRSVRDSIIDHRTHAVLCRLIPSDSECGR